MSETEKDFWAGVDLNAPRCWTEAPGQSWHYFCDLEDGHDGKHEVRMVGESLWWSDGDETASSEATQ